MDPSTIFAWIVTVLAALAVVGALAVVIVAEVYAIRRTIEQPPPAAPGLRPDGPTAGGSGRP